MIPCLPARAGNTLRGRQYAYCCEWILVWWKESVVHSSRRRETSVRGDVLQDRSVGSWSSSVRARRALCFENRGSYAVIRAGVWSGVWEVRLDRRWGALRAMWVLWIPWHPWDRPRREQSPWAYLLRVDLWPLCISVGWGCTVFKGLGTKKGKTKTKTPLL